LELNHPTDALEMPIILNPAIIIAAKGPVPRFLSKKTFGYL
jgi:hypothetical protein